MIILSILLQSYNPQVNNEAQTEWLFFVFEMQPSAISKPQNLIVLPNCLYFKSINEPICSHFAQFLGQRIKVHFSAQNQ